MIFDENFVRSKQKDHLLVVWLAMISWISSSGGGSATTGSDFETPLGTHEIAEIIL